VKKRCDLAFIRACSFRTWDELGSLERSIAAWQPRRRQYLLKHSILANKSDRLRGPLGLPITSPLLQLRLSFVCATRLSSIHLGTLPTSSFPSTTSSTSVAPSLNTHLTTVVSLPPASTRLSSHYHSTSSVGYQRNLVLHNC
jgi:hypothetical protein